MGILNDKEVAARSRVARLRRNLEAAASEDSPEQLWKFVSQIAASEEQVHWYSFAQKIPSEDLPKWLIRYSTAETRDQWSGRGNDLLRVRNDAKMEALRTIGEFLEIGVTL
jgi:hypothetical protein